MRRVAEMRRKRKKLLWQKYKTRGPERRLMPEGDSQQWAWLESVGQFNGRCKIFKYVLTLCWNYTLLSFLFTKIITYKILRKGEFLLFRPVMGWKVAGYAKWGK